MSTDKTSFLLSPRRDTWVPLLAATVGIAGPALWKLACGTPIEAGLGWLVAPALQCRSPVPLPATSAGPRAASMPMQPAASVMGLAPGTLAPDRAAVSR